MGFQAWHLTAMEEAGYMGTNEGLCNRVANYLAKNGSDNIGYEEFRSACIACNVDPDSITQADLDKIKGLIG